jgi:hypothetical protein
LVEPNRTWKLEESWAWNVTSILQFPDNEAKIAPIRSHANVTQILEILGNLDTEIFFKRETFFVFPFVYTKRGSN